MPADPATVPGVCFDDSLRYIQRLCPRLWTKQLSHSLCGQFHDSVRPQTLHVRG